MISANSQRTLNSNPTTNFPTTSGQLAQGNSPTVFADIFKEQTNIAVWQRELSNKLQLAAQDFLDSSPIDGKTVTVPANNTLSSISNLFSGTNQQELHEDVAELVNMFCDLFGLKQAGLRFTVLDRAMCPRFHTDKIPCRLVTTYHGIATEWLPHQAADRKKQGTGNNGKPDDQSGLYSKNSDIQQLSCGDVALLKGENWEGNENVGLIHRSPAVAAGERRLLLTLDFVF